MNLQSIPRGSIVSSLISGMFLSQPADLSCFQGVQNRLMLLKYLNDPSYELTDSELKSVQEYFNLLMIQR